MIISVFPFCIPYPCSEDGFEVGCQRGRTAVDRFMIEHSDWYPWPDKEVCLVPRYMHCVSYHVQDVFSGYHEASSPLSLVRITARDLPLEPTDVRSEQCPDTPNGEGLRGRPSSVMWY